jgi:hypothetical protein
MDEIKIILYLKHYMHELYLSRYDTMQYDDTYKVGTKSHMASTIGTTKKAPDRAVIPR